MSIGKSELVNYSLGTHNMMLTFDDGALAVKLKIYEPYLIGDANDDGCVTIGDVTRIQRIVAETEDDSDGTVTRRCDVDGNKLSVTDAAAIQRFIAKFENDPYQIGTGAKDFGNKKDDYELPFISA